ncbi:MAG TPA: glycine--tRNA ligase subunit beta [Nitrospira sp.]|nr:glycine--tRNA ligase subunit beta [Nitrospira sp.]
MKRSLVKKPRQQKSRSPKPIADLLLEIGVEELPYEFVKPALCSLEEQVDLFFTFHNLSYDQPKVYGTPRRLVLFVEGLAIHQKASTTEVMGPSKSVAFDQAGQPTKAGIGFARGQGIQVETLQVKQTPKGEYVFAVKEDKGRPTITVLSEIIPKILSELSFPKAMKWNETGLRFARPIRWIVALFGGKVAPIEVVGIKAGNRTYGHRVMGGGKPIIVKDFKTYNQGLERRGVIVDPERRRATIQKQIDRLCVKAGVELNDDDALIDQAVYTTEWPCAVLGSFKPEYLEVPSEILITSMKEHQGFFSVKNKKSGKLAPHFIAIANNQPKNMSLIRTGNERVLAARLADAKFFFDEDRKVKLEERGKKLTSVTFHYKLGTMAQKQERLVKLVTIIAPFLKNVDDDLINRCRKAAALCKADLLTGIVGEFPELQGVMGGEYAKHDGESEVVSRAIREQYLPRAIEGELPATVAGQVLSLADRLDSIAAFFYIGIVPTGSEDPFGLRRHATAIVRIVIEENLQINLGTCIEHAMNVVAEDGFRSVPGFEHEGRRRIAEFILERVRHYGRIVYAMRDDVIESVLKPASDEAIDLVDLVQKMKALEAVTKKPEFDPLIVGFKRAHRLVEKEQWTREPMDEARFQDAAESALHKAVVSEHGRIEALVKAGEYSQALDALVGLKPAIDAFFAAVMVNAEDQAIRSNRLSLLKEVDELFMSFADFSQIVVQGR